MVPYSINIYKRDKKPERLTLSTWASVLAELHEAKLQWQYGDRLSIYVYPSLEDLTKQENGHIVLRIYVDGEVVSFRSGLSLINWNE